MKLVTAFSTVALVLVPAVSLAQAPADTNAESSLKSKLEQAIGKTTYRSSETKSTDQNSAASAGSTNYPDRGAIKRTDK
jgi:hypothetical protein